MSCLVVVLLLDFAEPTIDGLFQECDERVGADFVESDRQICYANVAVGVESTQYSFEALTAYPV